MFKKLLPVIIVHFTVQYVWHEVDTVLCDLKAGDALPFTKLYRPVI